MNKDQPSKLYYLAIAIALLTALLFSLFDRSAVATLPYSQFLQLLEQQKSVICKSSAIVSRAGCRNPSMGANGFPPSASIRRCRRSSASPGSPSPVWQKTTRSRTWRAGYCR